MLRLVIICTAMFGLVSCMPAAGAFPENRNSESCYLGYHAFDLQVVLPASSGQVLALTQYAETGGQLAPVCRLDISGLGGTGPGYPIYTGEVDTGRSGICVSARTSDSGHIVSCASAAAVARAIDAPLGTTRSQIRLDDWRPFTGS